MTDTSTTATDDGTQTGTEATQTEQATYTPPATQADLDRIITDRVNRTKAQFKDYQQLKAAADELAQIKAANQTEAERQAQELTRWQSEAEKWRTAAVGNRVQALAADFADPSDAVSSPEFADLGKYLDAGGQIDEAAIQADLAALLERKPHWRRPEGAQGPRLPAPNPAQGTSGRTAATPGEEFGAILRGQLRS